MKQKKWTGRFQMILTFLLFSALILVPLLNPINQPQEDINARYTAVDPCFPVNQIKKYWREHYNMEADFLQCIPLHVIVGWDIEESYIRHPGAGDDRVKLLLQDKFTAYLELTYDQENLKKLEAFNIIGPSPCCPGAVFSDLLQIDASMLACSGGGTNCRPFQTSDPLLFQIIPQTDNFFSFTWRENMGSRSGTFGSSRIKLQPGALPSSMSTRRGIGGFHHGDNFIVNVNGEDSITWDEIQTGLEEGEFSWEFPIDIKRKLPANHLYSQEGKAMVTIQFVEEEEEVWVIMVEGWEKDTTQPPIVYLDPSGSPKKLPVGMDFQWQLQGEFTIGKRKKTRNYKKGHIILANLISRLKFGGHDLYRCEQVDCLDQTDITVLEGAYIDGTLTGNNVRLTWRPHSPVACVLCTPKVSYIKKASYRQQFCSKEFIRRISEENLPLQDGYTVTGGTGDWLHYKITLVRLD